MIITDFTQDHISEAAALALADYEEERRHVPILPPVDSWPDLALFADNELGAAAFENNKMVGFLGSYDPFDNAFRTTRVKGVFSPMEAHAAVLEGRAKIYAAMYAYAAKKWACRGAVSHAVCLYAHDLIAQQQFYRYGFGLRCIDAVRPMELFDCAPCYDTTFTELSKSEFMEIYPLDLQLRDHMRQSPTFMNVKPESYDTYKQRQDESSRYFAVLKSGKICAFVKIAEFGETFITARPDTRHINGAYCQPEYRGKGVYQNLLNYTISALKSEGYTRLGVDFESINPTAYGFWLKYFTAYTHSVVRRIDENCLEVFYHEK